MLFFFKCKTQTNSVPYTENVSYVFSIKYFDSKNINKKIFFLPPHTYTLGKEDVYNKAWEFDSNRNDALLIDRFSINVNKGIINEDQTPYLIKYANNNRELMGELTGLTQNNESVFIHPPREKFFSLLEFDPFPIIKFPLSKDKKWKETFMIPEIWSNNDISFSGDLKIEYEYKVIGQKDIKTKIGVMNCYVIEAKSENSNVNTNLTMYYSNEYGFVKLHYFNYDKSQLVFDLMEINNINNK